MALVKWPAQLPNPTISGYGLSPTEAILRTEMTSGPARQRRRYTQTPTTISVRWIMRDDQFSIFEAWYRNQDYADEGGAWFDIVLYGGGGAESQEARFLEPFQARPVAFSYWEITASLEVDKRPLLSNNVLAILLMGITIEQLEAMAEILRVSAHVTLPLYMANWNVPHR